MRRTRMVTAVVVAALAFASMPAAGFHSGRCPKAGLPFLEEPGTADVLDRGEIHSYRFRVPAGMTGLLHMQNVNGDVDIEVCRGRQRRGNHVCEGHNAFPFGDGCHLPEAALPCPICVGDEATWGPPLRPGNYRVDVHRCFQPEDDPCDYSLGVVPDPVFDAPVAYGLFLILTDAI